MRVMEKAKLIIKSLTISIFYLYDGDYDDENEADDSQEAEVFSKWL